MRIWLSKVDDRDDSLLLESGKAKILDAVSSNQRELQQIEVISDNLMISVIHVPVVAASSS